jgi:hypothetical protein
MNSTTTKRIPKANTSAYPRMHLHMGERTTALIEGCAAASSDLLGHRVSYSTTVRRALMLLAEHQKTLRSENAKLIERGQLAGAMQR